MQVRFWGTRGSIAAPGPGTERYGGNTSCVEVRSGDSLAVLDCGTGARALGGTLANGSVRTAHVMLTHFHWDHIQGFPFFAPVFTPGWKVHVYGAPGLEQGLEEALAGQMQYTYFPVRLADLGSSIAFHEVAEDTFQADRFTVGTQYLNHTCPAVGYRLTAGGVTVAYITDHEPFWPHDPELPLSSTMVHPGEQRHVAFFRGADLLIHDSQYLSEEYPAKRGWGHSTVEYVVDVAIAAGVRRLALFHHDPPRNDDQVENVLLVRARSHAARRGSDLEIVAASEGLTLDLEETAEPVAAAISSPTGPPTLLSRVNLLGKRERRRELREALAEDGYRLGEANLDGRASDWLVNDPDLLVVAVPREADALSVIQRVARQVGPRPLIAVVEGEMDDAAMRDLAEVATDVVTLPFGPPNLRARVRASLTRARPGGVQPRLLAGAQDPEALQVMDRLSSAEIDDMLRAATPCGFQPAELIFNQGDPPAGVYYIQSGLVRLVVEGLDGHEVTVGFAGPGDTVGEMSALDGGPRSAAALALDAVEAHYIPRDVFRTTLERSPETTLRLLRLLARRLRDVDVRLAHGTSSTRSTRKAEEPAHAGADDESARHRRRLSRLETLVEQTEVSEEQLDRYAHDLRTAYTRVRDWRQAVHALRTVTHLLGASRTPRGLHRQSVRTLVRLVNADSAGLFLANGERLARAASHGREVPTGWKRSSLPAIVETSLADGSPHVEHGKTSSGDAESTTRKRSTMAVALQTEGLTHGVLWLSRGTPFDEDDIALADIVANACALAMQRQVHEGLTQLPHSDGLVDLRAALEVEVSRARRLHYPIGVLLSRPESADRSQSATGLADAVRTALRRTDIVASGPFGELSVILPGIEHEDLSVIQAKVQRAIRQVIPGADPPAFQLGTSVLGADDADASTLIEQALERLTPIAA